MPAQLSLSPVLLPTSPFAETQGAVKNKQIAHDCTNDSLGSANTSRFQSKIDHGSIDSSSQNLGIGRFGWLPQTSTNNHYPLLSCSTYLLKCSIEWLILRCQSETKWSLEQRLNCSKWWHPTERVNSEQTKALDSALKTQLQVSKMEQHFLHLLTSWISCQEPQLDATLQTLHCAFLLPKLLREIVHPTLAGCFRITPQLQRNNNYNVEQRNNLGLPKYHRFWHRKSPLPRLASNASQMKSSILGSARWARSQFFLSWLVCSRLKETRQNLGTILIPWCLYLMLFIFFPFGCHSGSISGVSDPKWRVSFLILDAIGFWRNCSENSAIPVEKTKTLIS